MNQRLFCFGLGYSALVLARALMARGWSVAGTTRSAEKQAALRDLGIETHVFARERPLADGAAALAGATHVLTSIAPDEHGDPVLDRHLDDLRALHGMEWCGYLGTTGVYGDRDGAWVDETDAVRPSSARTRARVSAEAQWLGSGLPAHLFRLAGIYGPGPGRNALDTVRSGQARRIVKAGQVFSRIHVEDIAGTLDASMARPNPGRVYNVADDEPAPPQDVIAWAAKLLGVEPPPEIPFETAVLSEMARSFYADNRRVSNRRIKQELGVVLQYPSYREGLASILEGQSS